MVCGCACVRLWVWWAEWVCLYKTLLREKGCFAGAKMARVRAGPYGPFLEFAHGLFEGSSWVGKDIFGEETRETPGFAELIVCYELLRLREQVRAHTRQKRLGPHRGWLRVYREFVVDALFRLSSFRSRRTDALGHNAISDSLIALLRRLRGLLYVRKPSAEQSPLLLRHRIVRYKDPKKDEELAVAEAVQALINGSKDRPEFKVLHDGGHHELFWTTFMRLRGLLKPI